ncbi:MAG: MAPEG family protein, partial [Pseudomonadota bacterium]
THIALTGTAGRLQRALNNHFEGLILFTLAVVVVTLGQASSGLTQICAWIYVIARIAYVPAYVSGIPGLRSAIWMVGFGATALMIVSVLL